MILGYVMHRTRLVPRARKWLGLVRGSSPPGSIVMFGLANPATFTLRGLASMPEVFAAFALLSTVRLAGSAVFALLPRAYRLLNRKRTVPVFARTIGSGGRIWPREEGESNETACRGTSGRRHMGRPALAQASAASWAFQPRRINFATSIPALADRFHVVTVDARAA